MTAGWISSEYNNKGNEGYDNEGDEGYDNKETRRLKALKGTHSICLYDKHVYKATQQRGQSWVVELWIH